MQPSGLSSGLTEGNVRKILRCVQPCPPTRRRLFNEFISNFELLYVLPAAAHCIWCCDVFKQRQRADTKTTLAPIVRNFLKLQNLVKLRNRQLLLELPTYRYPGNKRFSTGGNSIFSFQHLHLALFFANTRKSPNKGVRRKLLSRVNWPGTQCLVSLSKISLGSFPVASTPGENPTGWTELKPSRDLPPSSTKGRNAKSLRKRRILVSVVNQSQSES